MCPPERIRHCWDKGCQKHGEVELVHALRGNIHFSERTNSFLVGVAVLCAIFTTSLMIRREFFRPSPTQQVTEVSEVASPEKYTSGGHRIGPDDATITIVEFADFECPYCRQAALGPLLMVRRQFGEQTAIVFRLANSPCSENGQ